jgi:hypothetical protein
MSLGDSADGRVARHLGYQINVESVEGGLKTHAGCSHGGFASGMTRADHNYVEMFGERHPLFLF